MEEVSIAVESPGRARHSRRILIVGTSMGGGDWVPLATVMIGLHQAGHSVRCFADPTIARDCAWASVPFDVVPEDEALPAYFARWRAAGATGPSPLLPWATAHLALIRSLVAEFRPEVVPSQLCTAELARLIIDMCISNRHYRHKKAGSSEAAIKDRRSAGRLRACWVIRHNAAMSSSTLSGRPLASVALKWVQTNSSGFRSGA